MVKRTSFKFYYYMVFALILLITCWEGNREQAVVYAAGASRAAADSEAIPQESIRLRILANSDSPSDQWIKREIRDAIVERMNQWVKEPQGIDEARAMVRIHLPELDQLVGETLQRNGFSYTYKVELGVVPFPAKMYGSLVYPAGDYEALRVSIGAARGQNWWCVLFPPLCFVDSEAIVKKANAVGAESAAAESHGEIAADEKTAVAKSGTSEAAGTAAKKAEGAKAGAAEKDGQVKSAMAKSAASDQPELRSFIWDLLKKIGSLFA
ncbi:stage II sporulation protein R [Paenibacillus piri]|uniref:Stage II sporulation protein R n=1 Tax=Paenibacillus piri TaxID=2547395 RepID=A0A4R5KE92_9BACL|nr:stage II sporulation protein R [Paenibacillus piri]TDF93563.1 stage II sporulation protein R [Paenibacillus piri]